MKPLMARGVDADTRDDPRGPSMDTTMFTFASRGGALVAIALVGVVGAAVGYPIWRAMRRRGGRAAPRVVVSALPAVALIALLYVSSLNGFYEAKIESGQVNLTGLLPWQDETLPASSITGAVEEHRFKSSWRLRLATVRGDRLSANTSVANVRAAVEALDPSR